VVRPAIGTGCNWKTKEQKLAKEKGSSWWLWWLLSFDQGGAGKELVCWWFSLADVRDGGGCKERMNRERDMIIKGEKLGKKVVFVQSLAFNFFMFRT
jgi:hypothetical protein